MFIRYHEMVWFDLFQDCLFECNDYWRLVVVSTYTAALLLVRCCCVHLNTQTYIVFVLSFSYWKLKSWDKIYNQYFCSNSQHLMTSSYWTILTCSCLSFGNIRNLLILKNLMRSCTQNWRNYRPLIAASLLRKGYL